jgi:UDP-glucose 4-epimerase
MLNHNNPSQLSPSRVVIVGAQGFVGKTLKRILDNENISNLGVGRQEVDLLDPNAADSLVEIFAEGDALVMISAEAPVKNNEMLENNIRMMSSVCQAIVKKKIAHLIYVSSDAVYADSSKPLTEGSCAEPESLHGVMHLAREVMLKNSFSGPLAIIRPTLIYGLQDPHNGYGPNRFRRLVEDECDITLFGNGEEQRDHIYVNDVAELIKRIILYKSEGVLNAATGKVISFFDIADKIIKQYKSASKIITTPRIGEMPHNGYRAFDATGTTKAFPEFVYTDIEEGINIIKSSDE